MKTLFVILFWGLVFISNCKSINSSQKAQLKDDPAINPESVNEMGYLEKLTTPEDYEQLKYEETLSCPKDQPPNQKYNLIKYVFDYKDEEQKIFFQNTKKYDWHFPFLKNELPKYANITNTDYETMIGFPRNSGLEKKELLVGSLYYSNKKISYFDEPGFVGFVVYYTFNDDQIALDEIKKVYAKLVTELPFVNGRIIYLFNGCKENARRYYFKYKMPLKDGINIESLPVDKLKQYE